MKKSLILAAILAVISVGSAVAQPRAIGANIGYGIDLSYQHSLGEANMIDVSVNGPFFEGIGATATYDWVNPFGAVSPWDYEGQWNWNLGVGAGLGIYGFKAPAFYAGVVGHVGISYDFWFPMQLSLDYRPNIGIVGGEGITFNTSGLYSGITLGVRYLF